MQRPERKRPDQGQSGWLPIVLLSLALHLTAIVSIPEAPPADPAAQKPAPIQFELVQPLPTPPPAPTPEPSPVAPATPAPPSPPPEPKPSPAEKPPEPEKKPEPGKKPEPEKKPEQKPKPEKKPEPRPSASAVPRPPPPPPPPPPAPIINRKVRLGPTLDRPDVKPSGNAPPPPVLAKAPPGAKPGVPDQDKKDGGAPDRPKLKAPIRVAPAPPVAHRARPKPMPKKLATRKGARDGLERAKAEKPKIRKGAPKPGARSPLRTLEDLAEAGAPPEEKVEKPALMPREVEKPEPDEDEGAPDGEKIELAQAAPPPPGADGEVPAGKDPAADEEGFIPLTEALRRSGGGAAPNIVPNWISSNFSQDGDIGLDEYKAALLALIHRSKVYPANWNPGTWQGAAQVAGTVDGFTGRLLSVWLVESSGRRDIDRAALQTIARSSPFPPIGSAGVLRFQIAIRYGGPDQQASAQ